MEEDVKGLSDYWDIIRRHRKLVIYPALVLTIVVVVIALLLPATYKSSGLILIESQEIPNDLVRTTVTSYADQRIEIIKQKLMTTNKVMGIVKKYNLYPEQRQKSAVSLIVETFRGNMSVDMLEANVTDSRSGRARRANIAFHVSFMDKNPQQAQKIANELVTEFLNENVRTRTARASETKAFLMEEGDKFQRKIQLLENKIAEFKDEFSDSLPELLPYNLSMVESLQEELLQNQNQIMVLKDQVMTMSLELANLDALYPLVGSQQPVSASQQLAQAKAEHASLQGKYSPNHPDIKRLKRQIESLENELGHAGGSGATQANKGKGPLFIKINSKIGSTEREIKRLHHRKNEVKEKLASYGKRVVQTHQVQRAYNDLTRDYDNNLAKYKELRAKQLQAELAENLESENKGESFTLIEPPLVASKPEKPNRPKIIAAGVVVSIAIGVGLALLFEMLMGGVRGYNQISRVINGVPLVVIPVITTIQAPVKKATGLMTVDRRVYWAIGAGLIVVASFHFLVMDLEILWFKVLRKINLL